MNLYISDTHFGHKNVLEHDHRPFNDVEEMDSCMIELWNSRVAPDDHVYILGDFCYRSGKQPEWYLKKLHGHKHLIVGNHDWRTLENERAMAYFESVDDTLTITDGEYEVFLSHYPFAEWYNSRHGSWHVYGHLHGRKEDTYQFMLTRERALNAAACINGYMPASLEELMRNNRRFQETDS